MNDNILTYLKQMILSGVDAENEDDSFNVELISHANLSFSKLRQFGVGPVSGFMLNDGSETWNQLELDDSVLSLVKSYIFVECKLALDPPQSTSVLKYFQDMKSELEWRITNNDTV